MFQLLISMKKTKGYKTIELMQLLMVLMMVRMTRKIGVFMSTIEHV